jgi:NADH pyrophosphatase NudC (nudix superfamily)
MMNNLVVMRNKVNEMKYCPYCGSGLKAMHIDGSQRYVCSKEKCGFIYWNNPIPVVAALVMRNNNYILARNVSWPKGIFSVIAGYLEQGESPEEAVIREVSEELGLKAKVKRHIGNYTFEEKNQIILCYEVEASGKVITNDELAETKELSVEELSAYDFSPLYIAKKIQHDWSILHAKAPGK